MRIALLLAVIFWAVVYMVTKENTFIIISNMFSCTLAIVSHSEIQNGKERINLDRG